MALKILVLCAFISLAASVTVERGRIALGDPYGAHIIHHEIHEKYAFPLFIRSEDIVVKTQDNEVIRAVVVNDLKGNGKCYISEGGIGQRFVTIHLEASRGEGYKFLVEVYAYQYRYK
ncbi:uncharacterized protein LOC113495887 [Trichoplusia ni]|uniref:Uncharacterized protein LOC113495887 n=1 Tax=Trichoplusia ni TaxID=7111 RepID=A0A7E5VQR7_TRINI|nr:uncharacterized protein LOC113495887 [Trichoplusia ni]